MAASHAKPLFLRRKGAPADFLLEKFRKKSLNFINQKAANTRIGFELHLSVLAVAAKRC